MSEPGEYRIAATAEISAALGRPSPYGFYVFISHTDKYLALVQKGETITADKREKLEKLTGVNLYVKEAELKSGSSPTSLRELGLSSEEAFEDQVLSPKASALICSAYQDLLNLQDNEAERVTSEIIALADAVLEVVAPEAKDLRASVLKNARNATLMNDAAGITSLAILCAMANEFRSRVAFTHLSQAVILMDASLGELEEGQLETYYRDRRELPSHIMDRINLHPASSQILAQKLSIYNETLGQLILMHQELNNGKGYHRGLKTLSHLPLGRVLCLAVDLYEHLKGARLQKRPLSLDLALAQLSEPGLDPHLRRHSPSLILNVQTFLGLDPKKPRRPH